MKYVLSRLGNNTDARFCTAGAVIGDIVLKGTREWATHNANCYIGCSHGCIYCYARANAARFNLRKPSDWGRMTPSIMASKTFGKKDGVVMFPTSHDITPDTLGFSSAFLKKILKPGNSVLIVSKPHLSCIRYLCETFAPFKDKVLFRFSIGTLQPDVSLFWEPEAPLPEERIVALSHAYESGFSTSVSIEPMLDQNVDDVISAVTPYVTEKIWIGKMNLVTARLRINGFADKIKHPYVQDLIDFTCADDFILSLGARHGDNEHIRWKDSIQQVLDDRKESELENA